MKEISFSCSVKFLGENVPVRLVHIASRVL